MRYKLNGKMLIKKRFINKNTNLDLFSLKLNRNFQQNNESINYILLFIFATEN